jgi:hypothetical protein
MRLPIRIFANSFTVLTLEQTACLKKVFTVMPGRHNYRPTAGDRVPAIDAYISNSPFTL